MIRITHIKMKHLVSLEEFMEAIHDDCLVVVDFYAQWCGPCKAIAPLVEKLAKEYDGKAVFYKVDVENAAPEVVVEVSAMPTFIFYRKGEQINLFQGANPKKLRQTVEELTNDPELSDSSDVTDNDDEK